MAGRRSRLGPPRAGAGESAQLGCRFLLRDDEGHVDDACLAALLGSLTPLGHWTLVRKLEEFDAMPAYAPTPLAIHDHTPA